MGFFAKITSDSDGTAHYVTKGASVGTCCIGVGAGGRWGRTE